MWSTAPSKPLSMLRASVLFATWVSVARSATSRGDYTHDGPPDISAYRRGMDFSSIFIAPPGFTIPPTTTSINWRPYLSFGGSTLASLPTSMPLSMISQPPPLLISLLPTPVASRSPITSPSSTLMPSSMSQIAASSSITVHPTSTVLVTSTVQGATTTSQTTPSSSPPPKPIPKAIFIAPALAILTVLVGGICGIRLYGRLKRRDRIRVRRYNPDRDSFFADEKRKLRDATTDAGWFEYAHSPSPQMQLRRRSPPEDLFDLDPKPVSFSPVPPVNQLMHAQTGYFDHVPAELNSHSRWTGTQQYTQPLGNQHHFDNASERAGWQQSMSTVKKHVFKRLRVGSRRSENRHSRLKSHDVDTRGPEDDIFTPIPRGSVTMDITRAQSYQGPDVTRGLDVDIAIPPKSHVAPLNPYKSGKSDGILARLRHDYKSMDSIYSLQDAGALSPTPFRYPKSPLPDQPGPTISVFGQPSLFFVEKPHSGGSSRDDTSVDGSEGRKSSILHRNFGALARVDEVVKKGWGTRMDSRPSSPTGYGAHSSPDLFHEGSPAFAAGMPGAGIEQMIQVMLEGEKHRHGA